MQSGSTVSMAEFFYFAFLEKLNIGIDFIIRFFFKFNPRKIIDKMLRKQSLLRDKKGRTRR